MQKGLLKLLPSEVINALSCSHCSIACATKLLLRTTRAALLSCQLSPLRAESSKNIVIDVILNPKTSHKRIPACIRRVKRGRSTSWIPCCHWHLAKLSQTFYGCAPSLRKSEELSLLVFIQFERNKNCLFMYSDKLTCKSKSFGWNPGPRTKGWSE